MNPAQLFFYIHDVADLIVHLKSFVVSHQTFLSLSNNRTSHRRFLGTKTYPLLVFTSFCIENWWTGFRLYSYLRLSFHSTWMPSFYRNWVPVFRLCYLQNWNEFKHVLVHLLTVNIVFFTMRFFPFLSKRVLFTLFLCYLRETWWNIRLMREKWFFCDVLWCQMWSLHGSVRTCNHHIEIMWFFVIHRGICDAVVDNENTRLIVMTILSWYKWRSLSIVV